MQRLGKFSCLGERYLLCRWCKAVGKGPESWITNAIFCILIPCPGLLIKADGEWIIQVPSR